MVRDMERSLVFFRDVLGANIWFDRPFTLDGGGLPIGKKGDKLRLVIVKFDHDEIGMLPYGVSRASYARAGSHL